MKVSITVNGEHTEHNVEPRTLLVHYIRETIGLTGTNIGCDTSSCGACTVHVDGVAERSCSVPVEFADGSDITTIEGLSEDRSHPVQAAWIAEDVPQCGYCQSGMIMSVASMLKEIPEPTDEDINAYITNICRCGTYTRIRKAIKRAASLQQ